MTVAILIKVYETTKFKNSGCWTIKVMDSNSMNAKWYGFKQQQQYSRQQLNVD